MTENILQQILNGIANTNRNIVDLSQEVVALREDMSFLKSIMIPEPRPADTETEDKQPAKKKK